MASPSLELPLLPKFSNYRFGVTIETVSYLFDFRWNTRDRAWYMDVRKVNEEAIVLGAKVVLGTYLGRRSNHRLFKRGVFVVVDTDGSGLDATYDDFGTRIVISYIPIMELLFRLRKQR